MYSLVSLEFSAVVVARKRLFCLLCRDLLKWRLVLYCFEPMSKGPYAKSNSGKRTVTILHGVGESLVEASVSQIKPAQVKRYCPFCDKAEHYLSQCASFAKLTNDQVRTWIRSNNHCWRCARAHHAAQCDLKKPCKICQGSISALLMK